MRDIKINTWYKEATLIGQFSYVRAYDPEYRSVLYYFKLNGGDMHPGINVSVIDGSEEVKNSGNILTYLYL